MADKLNAICDLELLNRILDRLMEAASCDKS